jgi:hypothetical protein
MVLAQARQAELYSNSIHPALLLIYTTSIVECFNENNGPYILCPQKQDALYQKLDPIPEVCDICYGLRVWQLARVRSVSRKIQKIRRKYVASYVFPSFVFFNVR